VIQGNIGDCYFLSALAALSEDDKRIRNVFQDQPMFNPQGIYKVVLRINGEIREYLVDDWIPVNSYNEPLFCQLNGNEFWVVILEKAWEKAHGSYASIIAGCQEKSYDQYPMLLTILLTCKSPKQISRHFGKT
jgi:calpain-15